MVAKCSAITRAGKPCKGSPLPNSAYCMAHDPEYAERRAEGNRKGGEARANAKRAARQWAAIGEQITPDQLPAMLRACMISVKAGTLEPAQASAIANLARTSVTITNEIEVEARLAALEEAAGIEPSNLRRIG